MEILVPYASHAHVLPNGDARLPDAALRDLALQPGDELQIFRAGSRIVMEKFTPHTGDIFDHPFAAFTEWADPINDAYNDL